MFSFDGEHEILEKDVIIQEMEMKYHDKYLIITNAYSKDARIRGDVIAILTPEEYRKLEKPKPMLPKYGVGEGFSLQMDGLGAYGFYL